jgi:tetratricopeptide (TPR) repeat protein
LGTYEDYFLTIHQPFHKRLVAYAHNEYIHFLCEMGWPAGLAVLWGIWRLLKRVRRGASDHPAAVAIGVAMGIGAFFDFSFHWDYLGVAAALLAAMFVPTGVVYRPGVFARWTGGTLAGVLALGLAAQAMSFAFHDRGDVWARRGDRERALVWFQLASRCDPWRAHFWADQADCLAALDKKDDALRRLERAVSLKPGDVWIRRQLVKARLNRQGPRPARKEYDRILAWAPRVGQFWKEYGDLCAMGEDAVSARRSFDYALRLGGG